MRRYTKSISFALRMMAKTPLITALSILVLGISIAQVTMMFNMIDSVLYSSLPFKNGERYVQVWRQNPANEFAGRNISFKTYHELCDQQKVFEGVMGVFSDNANLQTGLKHAQEGVGYISWDFTKHVGYEPLMGRSFVEEDALAGASPVVLISHKVWHDFLGGQKDIIGKSLMTDGVSRTVIGVMPKDFDFPFSNDIWIPLNTDTVVESVGWGSAVVMFGVLKEDVGIDDAQKQLDGVFKRIKAEFPVENAGFELIRLTPFKELFVDDGTRVLFMAMGICALLVLFMGCAIVSNLTTVRAARRSNELAVRSALGASRKQLVIQMLYEAFIMSAISFVLGWLFMDWFTITVLERYYTQFNVPSWFFEGGYSLSHLFFVLAVLLVVTITSTLIPALRASKTSINDLLKDSSRTGSSVKLSVLGRFLIIFQISAAVAVVTGGGIVGYYLHDMVSQEDYDKSAYLYATLGMDAGSHGDDFTRIHLMQNLKREMEQKPGVKGVAFSSEYFVPNLISPLRKIDGDYPSPDAYPKLRRRVVSPDYFKVMNYQMIAGREFNEFDDEEHEQVIIITDLLAKQFFGDENPIGKQLMYTENEEMTVTVVGVVKDLFRADRDRDGRTGFYRCVYQDVWFDMGIHIATEGNPLDLEPQLVSTLGTLDSRAVMLDIMTIFDREQSYILGLRFVFIMFLTFSVGALIMAAAGLYGVLSFSVAQRIREIGIRVAMGASPGHIIMRLFGHGMVNVWIGMFIGVLMALLLRNLLMVIMNPLFESVFVYMGVLLGILFVAIVSMIVPSIRGGYTDPAEALRID